MSEPLESAGQCAVPALVAEREQALLAPYAMRSVESAGREHAEAGHRYRGPYQRDRDRVIHSTAHRRLAAKMQVFTGELGDYHRTRLTHTLEVASVSRTLGRALRLNEDLVEVLALTHDLGHPPFGHAGEDVLDECLAGVGGFSHNRQALRIVQLLEHRYPDFPGLNLTAEVLAGQTWRIEHDAGASPLLEVQVVEAADSVAYNTHDADDALELGLLELGELAQVPLWREAVARVRRQYTAIEGKELIRAVLHELIDWQVRDLFDQTLARIARHQVGSTRDVRAAPLLVLPSEEVAGPKRELEKFLHARVYRHEQVVAIRQRAQSQLGEMFHGYCRRPNLLPPGFRARVADFGLERTVGDYLAGMTDRYAQQQHEQLFGGK